MLKELISVKQQEAMVREYKEESIKSDEIRVKVDFAASKHGTEFTTFTGVDPFLTEDFDSEYSIFAPKKNVNNNNYFMNIGNMWVGRIMEMGKDVKSFSEGERIAGYGSIRTTQTIKYTEAIKMKNSTPWQAAVCFDPTQFVLGGIRDAHVRLGDSVAVFGLGAIGLMAIQLARLSGASFVCAVDPISNRRDIANKLGADLVLDPNSSDVGFEIKKATNKLGVDVVLETSGSYPALQEGTRSVAYCGNIAIVGWYKECKYPLNLGREAHFNQPNIIFSRACSEPNRDYPRWSFDRILKESWRIIESGAVNCEDIIYPVVTIDESPKIYEEINKSPEKGIKLGVKF